MFVIRHANTYLQEREYIYEVIFHEFLGVSYQVVREDRANIAIEFDGKSIIVDDVFFQKPMSEYLQAESLPEQPLERWRIKGDLQEAFVADWVPVIYGNALFGEEYVEFNECHISIGIDVFGSAFFMLTRYEEIVTQKRDKHDRFSAKDSLAYQEEFLHRPIINEYVAMLAWCIAKLWPEVELKKRTFNIAPTHDVDFPFQMAFLTPWNKMRILLGDLIKRRSPVLFLTHLRKMLRVLQGDWSVDDYYTFDFIMGVSEEYRVNSCFFLMSAQGFSGYDGNYDLNHPEIIKLIRKIRVRGHFVGIHPSYTSYKSKMLIADEFSSLKKILANITENELCMGGRQHYLRWACPDTWQYYEDAGIVYDTTLGYADHIGFRCGVCYEYSVFNLRTRKTLKLKEKPLIVMECSALDAAYMNLAEDIAFQRIVDLMEKCRKYDGDFVLLWHNSRLVQKHEIELYKRIIAAGFSG